MNEKLRKIADKSNIDLYGLGCDRAKWEYHLEKFAELMIQECSVALNPMLRDMISRGQAVDLIKQHFEDNK